MTAEQKRPLDSEEADQAGIQFKKIGPNEVRILKSFLTTYQHFSKADQEKKIDWVVLLLTRACGYGSFNESVVKEAYSAIGLDTEISIKDYFERSASVDHGNYVKVGQTFKLRPSYSQSLEEELQSNTQPSSGEGPIRKKVQKAVEVKDTGPRFEKIRPKMKSEPKVPPQAKESRPPQGSHHPNSIVAKSNVVSVKRVPIQSRQDISSEKEQIEEGRSRVLVFSQKKWLIALGLIFLVGLIALAFALF